MGGISYRHCLEPEEGRGGRDEGADLAAGVEETSLLGQIPKRHETAPELRERVGLFVHWSEHVKKHHSM